MVRERSRRSKIVVLMALGLGFVQAGTTQGQTTQGQTTRGQATPTSTPSPAPAKTVASPSDLQLGMRAIGDDSQSLLIRPLRQLGSPGPFGGESKDIFWTVVNRRGVTDTNWDLLTTVSGYPVDATLLGKQLTLLMNDANWRTVYDGGSTAGEPLAVQGQRLRMIAGEEGTLLGYTTGGEQPRLFRLENSTWVDLGAAPEFAGELVGDMIVRGGRVVVAGLDAERKVRVFQSSVLAPVPPLPERRRRRGRGATTEVAADAGRMATTASAATTRAIASATTMSATTRSAPLTWSSLGEIGPLAEVSGVRLLALGQELALWPDPGAHAGGPVYKQTSQGGGWAVAFDLGSQNGELGASGGRLRFYYGDEKLPKKFERVLDYSGQTLGKPIVVDDGMVTRFVSQLSQMVLGLATAGFMVGIVMSWRRRDRETPETLLSAQSLPLAPYGRRLLAGLIDNIPWLIALGYLTWLRELTWDVSALKSMNAVIALLFAYATVVTHTTITEVIFGRTIGLMIAGLYVTDLSGKRPTPGSTTIRNLFRAVDLALLLPWLSIVFTSLRQSVGDAAAGTVVLSRNPAEASPKGDDTSSGSGDGAGGGSSSGTP